MHHFNKGVVGIKIDGVKPASNSVNRIGAVSIAKLVNVANPSRKGRSANTLTPNINVAGNPVEHPQRFTRRGTTYLGYDANPLAFASVSSFISNIVRIRNIASYREICQVRHHKYTLLRIHHAFVSSIALRCRPMWMIV
jgi:hypothetical protein